MRKYGFHRRPSRGNRLVFFFWYIDEKKTHQVSQESKPIDFSRQNQKGPLWAGIRGPNGCLFLFFFASVRKDPRTLPRPGLPFGYPVDPLLKRIFVYHGKPRFSQNNAAKNAGVLSAIFRGAFGVTSLGWHRSSRITQRPQDGP